MNLINDRQNIKRYMLPALALPLIILLIISQTGCGQKDPVSKTDFCLNTTCQIDIYDDMDGDEASEILDGAFEKVRHYEDLLSRTKEGSDIWRINHGGGGSVEVGDDAAAVIEQGLYMGGISGGKFDITVGLLSDLWNFTGEEPKVPEDADIQEALAHVDLGMVRQNGNRVSLGDPDAMIDLGGVAKGYIADRTAEYLEQNGVESAIVNLGGNIVAIGQKDEETLWNIGIERPYSDRTELIGSIEGKDITVVTSGIYERNFEEDGVLYHHVLDPRTGYPAETDLVAVTIKAAKGNSGFCDGLSTVCLMMGKEGAQALVKELQGEFPEMELEAAFIGEDDEISQTDGMEIQFSEE